MNHDGKVSKADNIDQTMTTFRAALARMDANPGEAARIRNLANATDAQMAAEAEPETLRRPRAYAARTYGELIALTADVHAKAARIDSLVIDAEHARQDDRAIGGGTRVTSDGTGGKAPDRHRHRHWRLQGTWLAFGGILAGVSAAVAWAATASSSMVLLIFALGALAGVSAAVAWAATASSSMVLLIFALGALLGVLAGGALCVRYLRATLAADIGPQLRRLHADIDPRLGRMRNQLDNIESAVNLALASRYAELSQQPWPPPVSPRPIPGQSER